MSPASPRVGIADGLYERTSENRSTPQPQAIRPRPCLRLYTDTLLVDVSESYARKYKEVECAVISLSFDYGGTVVASSDVSPSVYTSAASGYQVIKRDREFEANASYLLESFGAVELGCLDDYATVPGSEADYMVQVDGDVHGICSFGAYALPQLRSLAWRVSVDKDYRFQVVDSEGDWYAHVDHAKGKRKADNDWFSMELGVHLEGNQVNLLPVLVKYLEHSNASSLAGLMRSYRRCVALPIGDGRYLTMPTERFKIVMQVVTEMYKEGGSKRGLICFDEAQATALGQLEAAFGDSEGEGLQWSGDAGIRERGIALVRGHEQSPVPAPHGLQATLRPYQVEGLGFLQHLRANHVGGVLADDMGLGKTLQTIAHFLTEKQEGRMTAPCLVVAPTSLVGNWQREIQKFAPQLSTLILHGPKRRKLFASIATVDVVITTYPCLTRDLDEVGKQEYYILVLDEAHTIKNSRSLAHKAVKELKATHHLCITGTPVENHLEELWSLFDFSVPGLLGDLRRFRSKYRYPIERDGKREVLAQLRDAVQPYILRRRKEEVATELPPKTEIVRPVEITGAQRDLYESIRVSAHARVRKVIRAKGLAGSTIAILDALMKLRQVCCDPRLVNVRTAETVKESAKFELLFDLLPNLLDQGRRVLVFSQFTSMLALMAQELKERELGFQMLTGSTRNRQAEIDAFEGGKSDVFLLSLKAAGTGLNLTSADTVIHYDPWWNPAAQAQATDRAYRIGQKNPVFVYNLIVAGSVEEQMLGLQRRKRFLAESILEGGSGGGLDLSTDDVDGLFAPLDHTR
jgi:superfamily II DNA or RNA helicase